MNNKILIIIFSAIYINANAEAGHSINPVTLAWYEVNDQHIFEVSGCTPNSQVAYYSEVTGGKMLKEISTDAQGHSSVVEGHNFQPAFAINESEPGTNGVKGNNMVSYTGTKEFTLKDIQLQSISSGVILNWNAAVTIPGTYHFEILKSTNDGAFMQIGTIESTSASMLAYSFIDNEVSSNAKYELQITNGTITYTSTPLLAETNHGIVVFPAITNNAINIRLSDFETGDMYRIVDNIGRTVQSNILSGAQTTISVSNLAPGTYTMNVINKNKIESARFIKK